MISRDMNKPIVNQVTMIQSKFQRNQPGFYGRKVHLPAAIFNKSPSKLMPGNLQSPHRLGTPSRLQGKTTSPIRFRKQNQPSKLANYFTQPNMLGSGNSQVRSRGMPFLSNSGSNCSTASHGLKPGTFIVEIDNVNSIFCEKCAILYASQGYKVERMEKPHFKNVQYNKLQTLCELQNPERRSQLMTFLNQIQKISTNLAKLKGDAESVLKSNGSHFKGQQKMIQAYFTQIKDMIDLQKTELLQQVKIIQRQVDKVPEEQLKKIQALIADCESMKEDIYQSIEIIKEVDDMSFERVIVTYKSKAKQIKSTNFNIQYPSNLPKVIGEDVDNLSRRIVGMFNFRVETQDHNEEVEREEGNLLGQKKESVYFSFENPSQEQSEFVHNEPVTETQYFETNMERNTKNSLVQRSNSNLNYEYGDME